MLTAAGATCSALMAAGGGVTVMDAAAIWPVEAVAITCVVPAPTPTTRHAEPDTLVTATFALLTEQLANCTPEPPLV